MILLTFLILFVAVFLTVAIFFLRTLQSALNRVAPCNRLMRPGMVWLLLIPVFNLYWQYVVAVRVADSLRDEFRDRGRDDGSDYGRSLGATQTVLLVVSSLFILVFSAAYEKIVWSAAGMFQIVALVLFVCFWVKIAKYSRKLAARTTIDRAELDRRLAEFDQLDKDDQGVSKAVRLTPPPGNSWERDPGRYQ